MMVLHSILFFFNDTATTEIYTLSLHDALPIYAGQAAEGDHLVRRPLVRLRRRRAARPGGPVRRRGAGPRHRSEEHTSELQSHSDLVCRLLLEKKKTKQTSPISDRQPAETPTRA